MDILFILLVLMLFDSLSTACSRTDTSLEATMAKHETLDPQFDPPPFQPTTVAAARDSNPENGLVWWRPDGVISETSDNDVAMVRLG